jgi:hypothetical protein
MSRRHRGRPHHHTPANGDAPGRSGSVEPTGSGPLDSTAPLAAAAAPARTSSAAAHRGPDQGPIRPKPPLVPEAIDRLVPAPPPASTASAMPATQALPTAPPAHAQVPAQQPNGDRPGGCTAPQLRRFIKSRPYVPMHELRRRFAINGDDDDVTPVRLDPGWIFVGLPTHEGLLLGDLLRSGEIGYELSLDPCTPVVIGVYPMRPIPRT